VLVALSTSGSSRNVVAAVEAARRGGLVTWAVTGRSPNPLAVLADSAVSVDSTSTPTIQEVHQVVVHLLCEALDEALGLEALGSSDAEVVTAES
jgi:D-sedoheptulose 7-phosphate isomerase